MSTISGNDESINSHVSEDVLVLCLFFRSFSFSKSNGENPDLHLQHFPKKPFSGLFSCTTDNVSGHTSLN